MKTIQSLIAPQAEPALVSREDQREERALSLAKKFLTNLLNTEYFTGPLEEGKSLRRQNILHLESSYFKQSQPAYRGPIGRASIEHIGDFLERFFKHQVNNEKVLSLSELRDLIAGYQGVAK